MRLPQLHLLSWLLATCILFAFCCTIVATEDSIFRFFFVERFVDRLAALIFLFVQVLESIMPPRRSRSHRRSSSRPTRTEGSPSPSRLSDEALLLALSARNLSSRGTRAAREARLRNATSSSSSSSFRASRSPSRDRSPLRRSRSTPESDVDADVPEESRPLDGNVFVSPQSVPRLCMHLGKPTLRKIRDGEYVSFNTLLKTPLTEGHLHQASRRIRLLEDPDVPDGFSLSVSSGAQAPSRKVSDLPSWLEAWSVFLAATLTVHPEKAIELVSYQAFIVESMSKYYVPAVLEYDANFRRMAAYDPSMPWDKRDADLFAELIGASSSAQRSAFRGSLSSSSARGSFRGKSAGYRNRGGRHRYTTTADGTPICLRFNMQTGCNADTCRYTHACSACRGPHSAVSCDQHGRSH